MAASISRINKEETMSSTTTKGYIHPDVLVSTSWLAEHLHDPTLRILESNEDVLLYDTGHIPGAQKIDWHEDLR
jgi:thiosulfate/3-mercaptopyruvate sulfurtransferase